MKIYDDVICNELSMLEGIPFQKLVIPKISWPDDGNNGIVLRADMAFELGGGTMAAITGQAITQRIDLVQQDEILLYGPDLPEITNDTPYARIALIHVKEESFDEGNALYSAIRQMEYIKYHVHPHGFMTRISASSQREPARVSRVAIEQGLDFANVGGLYIEQYHRHPAVDAVKLIFISKPDFDYEGLQQQMQKTENITAALDHILKDFKMDCATCKLKAVCDEVESMRELHFGQIN